MEQNASIYANTYALAQLMAKDEPSQNNLLSTEALVNKFQFQLEDNIKTAKEKIEAGFYCSIEILDQCVHLPMQKEAIIEEITACFKKLESPEYSAKAEQALFNNISWKESLQISSKCMESLFLGAKALFETANYENSEKAFFMLCVLDTTVFSYWVGFAHASFQLGNYEQAIDGYSMASALQPENPWPHIWAANCFEKQGNLDYTHIALEEALTVVQAQSAPDEQLVNALNERIKK